MILSDSNMLGELQADGDIARSTKLGASELKILDGRDLTSIDASWLSSDAVGALEGPSKWKKGNSSTAWDQFEVNKRLYNVNSTYDENLYTKKLDRSELTKEQIKNAERFAKEIEGTRSSNVHLQEERGQVMERDMDEEDLYSGVLRPAAASSPVPKSGPKPVVTNGVNASNWRRAVTGEPSSPTTAQTAPLAKVSKTGASPAAKTSKGKGNQKAQAVPLRSPPGYDDEYIPATTASADEVVSVISPALEPADNNANFSTQKRAESPPQISFYGTPEDKPSTATATDKNDSVADERTTEVAPAAQVDGDKEKAKSDVVVNSKLNWNAKEFVFTPKASTPAVAPSVAAPEQGQGGKYHNKRGDGSQHGYMNSGYEDNGFGYGVPTMGMHHHYNSPAMMYNNGGMMMNAPLVPPVGDIIPQVGAYPQYPDMSYGMGPGMGMSGGGMYPHMYMHPGANGYDMAYQGVSPGHYSGRGGRGHHGGRGGYGNQGDSNRPRYYT